MSAKDGDSSDNESKGRKTFDGEPGSDYTQFEKKIARWCRKKYGSEIGDMFWRNELPALAGTDAIGGAEFNAHCEAVWDCINDTHPTKAKFLYEVASGFWARDWHKKWRKKQYDCIFDYVDSITEGQAAMEVSELGMNNAKGLRKHLQKQFGGSGDDVRAREERFAAGMPRTKGEPPFYNGVNVVNKLREMASERTGLWKMCHVDKRPTYEYGKEITLVKIVVKHLRGSEYEDSLNSLLQETEIQKKIAQTMPKMNAAGTGLVLPTADAEETSTDDWEFRNYSDAWLPSWTQLRSKLVSDYKNKEFGKDAGKSGGGGKKSGDHSKKLPAMLLKSIQGAVDTSVKTAVAMVVPGFGSAPFASNPAAACWNCGEEGHKSYECKKPKKNGGSKGKGGKGKGRSKRNFEGNRANKSIDMSTNKSDEICRTYRDTGKCRWGEKCKFVHVEGGGSPAKKFKLTKTQRREITAAAVQQIKSSGNNSNKTDGELEDYLNGFW